MITRIIDEYPAAQSQIFAGNKLSRFIRNEAPASLEACFSNSQFARLAWHGSAGQGQWADAPWIAALDPLVTSSPQEGYYPVYLFTRGLDAVYLSLTQGMTSLRREFGANQAKDILANRALILRTRLQPEYLGRFTSDPIDLQPVRPNTRLAFYEPGHIFGFRYERQKLPGDTELMDDLVAMLSLYELAIERGGVKELDADHMVAESQATYDVDASLEERRHLQLHFRIERNAKLSRLAKQHHGYTCQVCGFDYEKTYGELGCEYIEAHHLIPLSQLPPGQPMKLSPVTDFAVLCANCHRMIHRKGAPPSFSEFQKGIIYLAQPSRSFFE